MNHNDMPEVTMIRQFPARERPANLLLLVALSARRAREEAAARQASARLEQLCDEYYAAHPGARPPIDITDDATQCRSTIEA